MERRDSIVVLKGIGTKIQSLFQKLNIVTIADLLQHFPRTYMRMGETIGISMLRINEIAAVKGRVKRTELVRTRGGKTALQAYVADDSGRILLCSWFNMPYLKHSLKIDSEQVFYGKVTMMGDRIFMSQPKIFDVNKYENMKKELQPVYSLTKGLNNSFVSSLIRQVLEDMNLQEEYREYLPDFIMKKHGFMPRYQALYKIHRAKDEAELRAARDRLVFDEFFIFLLKLFFLKEKNERVDNTKKIANRELADRLSFALPFALTEVQLKALDDIYKDMNSLHPMNRLLQGDVGSGKTIVAILSMLMAYESGYQSAFMAPTEVLAVQHYSYINSLILEHSLSCKAVLLVGSMTAKQKKEVYEKIEKNEADFIIGTHALIQDKLKFNNLALVITDEQHRFGVKQRKSLSDKSDSVHTLVMSATPIPRTLAIMLYGELDISVMNVLPSDRLPIKNAILNEGHRKDANAFLLKQVRMGRQCYIVCPMIDVNEELDLQNVTEYKENLQAIMPKDIKIAALHGAMAANEKNRIMEEFSLGHIDILVATTVIEVGVNVPNATVMLIEDADRFGLAQLHQLRGRVGRGKEQSYAMFMSGSHSDAAIKRLQVLKESNDGFYIAEQDLKLRGPGELFGLKQSGALNFRLADIYSDTHRLTKAAEELSNLNRKDSVKLRELAEFFDDEQA